MRQKYLIADNLKSPFMLLMMLAIGVLSIQSIAVAAFDPPPDRGAPSGTAGGGSRSIGQACLQEPDSAETLVALSPQNQVGLTASDRPHFWVYVPPTIAKTLEFSLFDEQKNGLYQAEVAIDRSGLVEFSLPADHKLEPGKSYYWTVALVCNAQQRTEDWVVGSWLKYQPLNSTFQSEIDRASQLQQIDLYTNAGFWYEAMQQLLSLYRVQPQNPELEARWFKLTQLAGLSLNPTRLSALP